MSAKAIREFDGKRMLSSGLEEFKLEKRFAQITSMKNSTSTSTASPTNLTQSEFFAPIEKENTWLLNDEIKLVVKPDQLIKRRGKANLLLLDASWEQVKEWVWKRINKEIRVEAVSGRLSHFIVEPFVKHSGEDEHYVCIVSNRNGEEILFHHEGGVDIGDVDSKAMRLQVSLETTPSPAEVTQALLGGIKPKRQEILSKFIVKMLELYRSLHFVYMEINPIVLVDKQVSVLDMAAKLDETASFLVGDKWGEIHFPPAFGRAKFPEEEFIADLDGKTGASLKLTILNHRGRIWTMVAGGGASVVYADTIADLGFGHELANYGEYSGAPSEAHTYQYARTILDLMTREPDSRGKILIIGGGIANFTDVALTFKGIIRAIEEYQQLLKEHKVTIWVRRGGPNYQEGLRVMREVGKRTGVSIHVFGPETHITGIVPMALGLVQLPSLAAEKMAVSTPPAVSQAKHDYEESHPERYDTSEEIGSKTNNQQTNTKPLQNGNDISASSVNDLNQLIQDENIVRMTSNTRCIVYGMQQRAVQGMLDFDYLCKRKTPSVAAMIFPFSPNHYLKFYWGTTERLIPVFQSLYEASKKFNGSVRM
jgi:ATP citrate (pro-S)-lyase